MGEVYIRLLRESVRVRLHGLRRFVHCNHKTDAALKCVGLVQSGSVQCDVSHTHEINDNERSSARPSRMFELFGYGLC